MKKIAVLLLFLLPSLGFGLTPEQRSAQTAARINASFQTKSSKTSKAIICEARSQNTAAELNKKVWILTPDNPTVMAVKTTTTTTAWSTRAPVGHTHTCKNGHTWDHQLSASHNCPYCGQAQYVQDSRPRPVTIKVAAASSTREVEAPRLTAPAPVVRETYTYPAQLFSDGGGCANGQCQTQTRRFFR